VEVDTIILDTVVDGPSWHVTPHSAQSLILHAAHLAHFAYWYRDRGSIRFDDLSKLSADDPALQPPKYGPVKPFDDAAEVHRCIQSVVDGGSRLDTWLPSLNGGLFVSSAAGSAAHAIEITFCGTFDAIDISDDSILRLCSPDRCSRTDAVKAPRSADGRVHMGFCRHLKREDAHRKLLARLRELVATSGDDASQPVDVLLTGHSLGGGIATLFALVILRDESLRRCRLTIVTFGCPRVGNAAFVRVLDSEAPRLRHYRVQNELDLVSRAPYWLPSPGKYKHHQTFHVWLTSGRVLSSRTPFKRASMPLNLLFFATRWVWRDNKAGVPYHKMGSKTGYVRALIENAWEEGEYTSSGRLTTSSV